MNTRRRGTLRAVGFVAATLLATVILVAAGLGDEGQGPRAGWFGVSLR